MSKLSLLRTFSVRCLSETSIRVRGLPRSFAQLVTNYPPFVAGYTNFRIISRALDKQPRKSDGSSACLAKFCIPVSV